MRRERVLALTAAVALVIARSLPYALFDRIQFDSDQAITGLMAKHLAEGRAFPLFIYGLQYLLAVEAWMAAPLFFVGPVSLFTLSVPVIAVNVAAAVAMIVALERWGGLRPLSAMVASLFFLLPPPIVAGDLVSASGGNVEPFLYVTVLWLLRHRPLWFGATLAIGFLQREFTIYALPVLLVGDIVAGRAFAPANIRRWLLAGAMFIAVWEGVQALSPYADMMGPGTRGQLLGGFAPSQVGSAMDRANVRASDIPDRVESMWRLLLPRIFDTTAYEGTVRYHRPWLAALLVLGFTTAAARIAVLVMRRGVARGAAGTRAVFGWYLMGVGTLAAGVLILTHPISEEYARYGLLILLAPIGVTSVFLSLEPRVWARRLAMAVVIGWSAVSALDTARLYARFAGGPPSDFRILADALVARGARSAYAGYWTAYVTTFVSGERVRIASTDVVRITEYQELASSTPGVLVVRDAPCAGGEKVARWYLCPFEP